MRMIVLPSEIINAIVGPMRSGDWPKDATDFFNTKPVLSVPQGPGHRLLMTNRKSKRGTGTQFRVPTFWGTEAS